MIISKSELAAAKSKHKVGCSQLHTRVCDGVAVANSIPGFVTGWLIV